MISKIMLNWQGVGMLSSDPAERFRLILPLTGGNEDAAALLVQVGDMIRLADDVADGDAADPQEAMARVLQIALAEIPANPFYDLHRHMLSHLLGSMVTFWQVSNRFQKRIDARSNTFGFVLREAGEHFTLQVCALCRGWESAADIYEEIFALVHAERTETVEDWAEEAA